MTNICTVVSRMQHYVERLQMQMKEEEEETRGLQNYLPRLKRFFFCQMLFHVTRGRPIRCFY